MYHVQQTGFGYVLTLDGAVDAAAMKRWFEATCDHLHAVHGPFGVLVDVRRCRPLPKAARFWLLRGQSICEAAGLKRAAVLVDSAAQDGYWPALTTVTVADRRVRFIDAARHYPRMRALSWIVKGVEPNLNEGSAAADTPISDAAPNVQAILQAAQW